MTKFKDFIFLLFKEFKSNPVIVIFFFLPLFPKILPIVIIIALINSISTFGLSEKINQLKSNKSFWFIYLFFILYFVGVFYSGNQNYAWRDIETKLSFLVMPFLFVSNNYTTAQYNKFFSALLYGVMLSFLYCEIQAIYNYSYEMYARRNNIILDYYPNTNFFYTSYFCPFLHHSYFSLYVCLVQAFLLDKLLDLKETFLKKLNLVFILCLSILLQYQLLSKAGLISTVFIFAFFSIKLLSKSSFNRKILLPVFVLFAIALVASFQSQKLKSNFQHVFTTNLSVQHIKDLSTTESSEVRVLVWSSTLDLISKNWLFGTGTGDIKDELLNDYKQKGFTGALEKKLNSHNQYLQTFAAIGIFGFLSLLAMIIYFSYCSLQSKNFVFFVVCIVIAFNLLFESMLEVQAGTIFIAMFFSVIASATKKTQKLSTQALGNV
jgi:O-antigen ligase